MRKRMSSLKFPGLTDVFTFADEARDYSTSSTYTKGEYRVYNGDLYKCNTNIVAAEPFTPAHWDAVRLADEVKTLFDEEGGGSSGGTAVGRLNVKDYGAKGDGETIDTSAIRTAVAAARSLGYELYFPAGTYLVNDTIDITGVSICGKMSMDGNGYNTSSGTMIKAAARGTGIGIFECKLSTSTDTTRPVIRDIILNGDRKAEFCVFLNGSECDFDRVYCQNSDVGLKVSQVYNGIFSRSMFTANTTYGISFGSACNNLEFRECIIGANSRDTDIAYANVYANGGAGAQECSNLKFVACELDNPFNANGYMFDMNRCCVLTLDKNYIEGGGDAYQTSIFRIQNSQVFNFTDNYVIDANIDIDDGTMTGVVTGNSFKCYNKQNGADVTIKLATGAVLGGNYIDSNYTSDIDDDGGSPTPTPDPDPPTPDPDPDPTPGSDTGAELDYQQTVTANTESTKDLDTPISANTQFTIKNKSSNADVLVYPKLQDNTYGADLTNGNGLGKGKCDAYTVNYAVYGFKFYVNNTDLHFSLSTGDSANFSVQETVTADDITLYGLETTIPSGTQFKLKNESSTTIVVYPIGVGWVVSNTDLTSGGLTGGSTLTHTHGSDIIGFKIYHVGTDLHFSLAYGNT